MEMVTCTLPPYTLMPLEEPPPNKKDHEAPRMVSQESHNMPGQRQQFIVVTLPEPPVQDHLVWSIFNMVFLNFCCLGLVALVFSVKARDQKMVGNWKRAQSYGSTARTYNLAASILCKLSVLLLVILLSNGILSLAML